jgi:DNA-binding transcriptional LysR family regulator
VVFHAGCSYLYWLKQHVPGERTVPIAWCIEFGTLEGIVGCVSAGLGGTLLPSSAIGTAGRAVRASVHRLPADYGRAETIFIIWLDTFVPRALTPFLKCSRA